jgi:hypothetical protein
MHPTLSRTLLLVVSLFSMRAVASSAADLESGFVHPPASARPWVYWFPLDGNITSNGITADLEAMQRVGIGGVLYMETEQGTPKGPADFGGPLWRALFQHACQEANRLGLQVNMNNDAGWCGSGGPWITPELSMQKVVGTETAVKGPRRLAELLPQPETIAGFYRDIAVLAFRTPAGNAHIAQISAKAALTPSPVSLAAPANYPSVPRDQTIPRDGIFDLTARLSKDGLLDWDVPEGDWTVLRLGHTTTGKNNHPAPLGGRGLECDKLSRDAVKIHFDGLMAKLIRGVGPLAGPTLVSTHIDSWEVGYQNWTPRFREEFQKRRGYDLWPFLPVFSGRIVDGVEISERFLWDLRQTISELLLDNYAGYFQELAHQNGLRLSIEAYTTCPTDEMAYAGRADEPMGEFWSWSKYGAAFSCTEMASAAHVYGKRIVGAEAFTATDAEKWQGYPGNIKDLGDWAFCEGINRFVFHRYALQPWADVKPGISMGPWGLHYERTQTWWEQSKAWHQYLARCQFLLQQGLFVAEICLLGPEGAPQTLSGQRSFLSHSPDSAEHPFERPEYNFDTCPPEVVLTRMSVKDGRLVLPDGMSYRVLVLPQVETMTPQLLRKIKELVTAGATVLGTPPLKSPSLSGYPGCDQEVQQLATELWGANPAGTEFTERRVGQGRMVWEGKVPDKASGTDQPQLSLGKWIWFNEGDPAVAAPIGSRYFRRVIQIDGNVASARLLMTADNSFECWVNGHSVGSGDNFGRSYRMAIASSLKPGANLIAVRAVNGADQPNPAGLIAALRIRYEDGREFELASDRNWEAARGVPPDWRSSTDTQGWQAAKELGPLGMAPWGDIDQSSATTDIFPNITRVGDWLQKAGVAPDFAYRTRSSSQSLRYIHRTLADAELYFIANKTHQTEEAICQFRVAGKRPELWWPDEGRVERPAAYEPVGETVHLPLRLGPAGSVFVVFRDAREAADPIVRIRRDSELILSTSQPLDSAVIELSRTTGQGIQALVRQPGTYAIASRAGKSWNLPVTSLPEPLTVTSGWELSFPNRQGSSERITLDKLVSWTDLGQPNAKYFSGTATYRTRMRLPSDWVAKNRRILLDLGRVQVMAEVKLNGHDCGILWKTPFQVDVTEQAQAGDNELEIDVVNLWINRMIGDEQLPEDSDRNPDGTLRSWPEWLEKGLPSPAGRQTFTSWRLWKKDAALQESGLLGPVVFSVAQVASLVGFSQ